MRFGTTVLLCALISCTGSFDSNLNDDFTPDGQVPAPSGGQSTYSGNAVVYAHSATSLYKVDPSTLKVQLVGPFQWPGQGQDEMTDIALDRDGKITGISHTKVYAVDAETAACTLIADLDSGDAGFNGLSFLAADVSEGKERLMAAGATGLVYEIDPSTGRSAQVGSYGGPGSSGDFVSVKGLGTFATVNQVPGAGTDWLARIDPATWKATLIGEIGFANVWGLGFWGNKFYGFTDQARFIVIDPKTGKGAQVSSGGASWWGAGVTTKAFVVD